MEGEEWESLVPRMYKELLQFNNKIKRCSTLVIIRETQIKTTVRHFFIPVEWLYNNLKKNIRCWQECEEVVTLYIGDDNVK